MRRQTHLRLRKAAAEGRLLSRPGVPTTRGHTGLRGLGLEEGRDALLWVPQSCDSTRAAPLVVVFHGAGGDAEGAIMPLRGLAESAGTILLAPESRRQTWGFGEGACGPDVGFVDRALAVVFGAYTLDPARIATAGFSDGASFALSLGLANGDMFSHVIAFSPGFVTTMRLEGRPRVYVSHGSRDAVLPIDRCSRVIVPQLERAGYDVLYREFDGGHVVPAEVAAEAFAWFAGD